MNAVARIAAHPALAEVEILRLRDQLTWRPIDSAPKDGTRILMFGMHGRIADGYWSIWTEKWSWPHYPHQPTHWMPLPAPPSQPNDHKAAL